MEVIWFKWFLSENTAMTKFNDTKVFEASNSSGTIEREKVIKFLK